jgi:hypothetical protein
MVLSDAMHLYVQYEQTSVVHVLNCRTFDVQVNTARYSYMYRKFFSGGKSVKPYPHDPSTELLGAPSGFSFLVVQPAESYCDCGMSCRAASSYSRESVAVAT